MVLYVTCGSEINDVSRFVINFKIFMFSVKIIENLDYEELLNLNLPNDQEISMCFVQCSFCVIHHLHLNMKLDGVQRIIDDGNN